MDPRKGEKFRREQGGKESSRSEEEKKKSGGGDGRKKKLEENLSGGNPPLCPPTIRILLPARGIIYTIFSRETSSGSRTRKENAGILGPEISETESQTARGS